MYRIGSGAVCAPAAAACVIRNRATSSRECFAAITRFYRIHTGFGLAIVFFWQLAYPGKGAPLVAVHDTIRVFLAVVPLSVGAFNYVVPLQIGAPDMAFPRLNMSSDWLYLVGGIVMIASFFAPQGAPNSGWTSYPPLADFATMGQTFWLAGMFLLILSALLVTAFLLLLAFPPLQGAAILQAADRLVGTSFFLPSGLVVSGEIVKRAGGGNPLLAAPVLVSRAHGSVRAHPGLGHYRMRGFYTIQSQADFDAWLADQAAQLVPANP